MTKFKSMFAALSLGLAGLASAAPVVQLSTVGDLTVGSSFVLRVDLDQPFDGLTAGADLLTFGFALSYDTSVLQLSGFTPDAGWDDDSIFLGAGQFGGSHFPGVANTGQASLRLATLTFQVLGAGQTLVDLSSDPTDFNMGLYYSTELSARPLEASLALPLANSVPEPASALLVLAGLFGLCAARRYSF